MRSHDMDFPPVEALLFSSSTEYSGTKRFGSSVKITKRHVPKFSRCVLDNEVVIDKGIEIGQKIVVQGIVNMRDGVHQELKPLIAPS